MKKLLLAVLLGFAGNAWAGATFSRVKTWSSGETLTASDLNAEFNNLLTNGTPAGMDDYSATATEMRANTDPYPSGAESLATSLQGELERLRYQMLQFKNAIQTGQTYWYEDLPTAGVFTIVGSSVGINDTSPDTGFDVEVETHFGQGVTLDSSLSVSGNITSDASITTTGDDVDVSTHLVVSGLLTATNTVITGNLTVSGATDYSGATKIYASTEAFSLPDNSYTYLTAMAEAIDSSSEFDGSTFTVTTAGTYRISFVHDFDPSSTETITEFKTAIYKNGVALTPYGSSDGDVVRYSAASAGDLIQSGSGTYLFSFAASDTIRIRVFCNSSGTGNPIDLNSALVIERVF